MNGIRIDSYLSDPTICKNAEGVDSFFRYFLTTNIVIKNMEKKRIQSIALIIMNTDDNKIIWNHIYLIGNENKEYDKLYTNDIQKKFWEIHNSLVWNYINETISKIKPIN